MKKNIVNLTIILSILFITGCSGLGDYQIELINGYRVISYSAHDQRIRSSEDTDYISIPSFDDAHKGECLETVGHDGKTYIIGKTNLDLYYILNSKKNIIYGPFNKAEFDKKKKDLNIPKSVKLKSLNEYDKDLIF